MPISSGSSAPSIIHPGYLSGRYYLNSPLIKDYTNSAVALILNAITYVPFYIESAININRLAVFCGGPVTNGGGRIAIYSNNNGYPSSLLVDGGNLSIASAGAKEVIVDLSPKADWYWFAGTAINAAPNLSCSSFYIGSNHYIGQSTPGIQGSEAVAALRNTGSSPYTSFPSTAPVNNLSYLVGNIAPLFWYKIA